MNKKTILAGVAVVLILFFVFALLQTGEKTIWIASNGYLIADGKNLSTDFKLIHTVRIGDIFNDNSKVVVIGAGNGFYGPPWGCWVQYYSNGKWNTIDRLSEVRCKDIAIGDADNDGLNEIVLGTHGTGIIKIYKWVGGQWRSQVIEQDFIGKMDSIKNESHLVPPENLTYNYTLNDAVHIVKIGDADNDGKNEIIASISSPLEFAGEDVSYLNLYRQDGSSWTRETIDQQVGREFRSIAIGDVFNNGRNVIVTGSGVMWKKKEFASLVLYDFNGTKWNKRVIEDGVLEKNMKGLAIGKIYNNSNTIVVATGYNDGLVYTYDWTGAGFNRRLVGNVSDIVRFNVTGLMYNSMEAQIRDREVIVSGMAHTEDFGWENTQYGFTIVFSYDGGKWTSRIIDRNASLGMDADR